MSLIGRLVVFHNVWIEIVFFWLVVLYDKKVVKSVLILNLFVCLQDPNKEIYKGVLHHWLLGCQLAVEFHLSLLLCTEGFGFHLF